MVSRLRITDGREEHPHSGAGCRDRNPFREIPERFGAAKGICLANDIFRLRRFLLPRPFVYLAKPALRRQGNPPMQLQDQIAVVTGGSRGIGRGIVEALTARGAKVTVVARTGGDLEDVAADLGAAAIAADITDPAAARKILSEVRPSILVLNAGTLPSMAALDELSWEEFSSAWDVDVKAGLYWMQAALATPLAKGSRVLVSSSGAAIGGSPMSGGYAGAKRMLWLMANYADRLAGEKGLGIRFQTIIPRQQIAGTGVGDLASAAYSAKLGLTPEAFLARFGAPMPPRQVGEHVVSILTEPRYENDRAFGLKGDSGISIEEAAG
jgi:NAD(P)-dependent dehydrogenase (short-subunit alcohol dehydrogenase family)